jgi:very-short-patch-repair endonuclease
VEHLRPGDWVYAHDGQPHRVVRTLTRRYSGTMTGIRRAGCDDTLWLTADHLVLSERYVKQMRVPDQVPPPRMRGGSGWGAVPPEHFGRARALRRSPSPPEALLWNHLRARETGVKFRRQHPIGPYIADFYSRQAALVVEVDGETHCATEEAIAYDRERDRYMEGMGLRVLRLPAAAISSSTAVLETIADRAREAVLDDDPAKQWRRADRLKVGDVVFAGVERRPQRIVGIERQASVEEVYDLEVEGAHSFLTEVCAVHNCGSGTTAYVAEQWGRRWIAIDTSRVPLALARQRLLTATFAFYQLREEQRGPAGGFVYVRKQNSKGEEVGGIVPHVTLKSIANNEPPEEEVLVDRPEVKPKITRVTGPFCVEATIPTPVDWEGDGVEDSGVGVEHYGSFVDRMLEVLRKSPVLHVGGGRTVTLRNVRQPAKTLSLSAEAVVANGPPLVPPQAGGEQPQAGEEQPRAGREGEEPVPAEGRASAPSPHARRAGVGSDDETQGGAGVVSEPSGDGRARTGKPVALVFGPENGAVSEKLVYEAAREAYAKSYTHLYVIGFAIQPNARQLVDQCDQVVGVPATYVQATPDLMMGDLLKNMRSSQIFSVCGLPEVKVRSLPACGEGWGGVGQVTAPPLSPPASGGRADSASGGRPMYQVELVGLDVFDPATMEAVHRGGNDVPAWFLDTDYNGLCFHVCQAFFPRTAAWDDLKRALKGEYEDSLWEHLAGTTSAPFEAGEHAQVAVKVIDDRGNELMVVKSLKDTAA